VSSADKGAQEEGWNQPNIEARPARTQMQSMQRKKQWMKKTPALCVLVEVRPAGPCCLFGRLRNFSDSRVPTCQGGARKQNKAMHWLSHAGSGITHVLIGLVFGSKRHCWSESECPSFSLFQSLPARSSSNTTSRQQHGTTSHGGAARHSPQDAGGRRQLGRAQGHRARARGGPPRGDDAGGCRIRVCRVDRSIGPRLLS
jgi:hypothetical protein